MTRHSWKICNSGLKMGLTGGMPLQEIAPATEQAYKPFTKYFARSTQSTRRNKKSTYFTLR